MPTAHTPRTSFRRTAAATLIAAAALIAAALPVGARAQVIKTKVVGPEPKPQVITPHPVAAGSSPSADASPSAGQTAPSTPASSPPPSSPASSPIAGAAPANSSPASGQPAGAPLASSSPASDQTTVDLYAGWWGHLYADATLQGDANGTSWLGWFSSLSTPDGDQMIGIINATNQAVPPSSSGSSGDSQAQGVGGQTAIDQGVQDPGAGSAAPSGPAPASSEDSGGGSWWDTLKEALAAGVPGSTGGGVFVDNIPVGNKAD